MLQTDTRPTVSISVARSHLSELELQKALLDGRITAQQLLVDYLALLIDEDDTPPCEVGRGIARFTCCSTHRELLTTREALRARARELREELPRCRIFSSGWWEALGVHFPVDAKVGG